MPMGDDTLIARFHAQVKRLGDRAALRKKHLGIWREISWNEYAEHAKYLCLGLLALGLERRDRVCVLAENCPEWLYADVAIQTAGAITVGVYPANPPKEVLHVHEHSDAKFSICGDQEQIDKVLEVREKLPHLEKIIVIQMRGLGHYSDGNIIDFHLVEKMGREYEKDHPALYEELIKNIRADDVAVQIYTSGTTGPSKGAMLTHGNMVAAVDAFTGAIKFYESDNLVSYVPLSHAGERISSVYIPIKVGATVNFSENVETVVDALYEISPTVFFGLPRIWEKLQSGIIIKMKESTWTKRLIYNLFMSVGEKVSGLKMAKKHVPWHLNLLFRLGRLLVFRKMLDQMGLLRTRIITSGAAAVGADVLHFFHQLGLDTGEFYGQTEMSGITFINPRDDIRIGTVGKALPGVEAKIAEDGEIMVRGPQLFVGYYKDEQAFKEAVVDGWLLTGDVGGLDEDGYLRITDRKKDLLVTPGEGSIGPQMIENKLKFSPYIKEAMMTGGEGYPYLAALIQIDTENVGKWAQEHHIPYTTFHDLSAKPEVYDLIAGVVEKVNEELARGEQIKKFLLLRKELDHDDNELTATFKLRRKKMYELYKDTIAELYHKGRKV